MCGSFSLTSSLERLQPRLRGSLPPGLSSHYSGRDQVLPGQPVLLCRHDQGRPETALALWGLLPAWARDPSAARRSILARRPILARSETVAEKASFRGPWRHHRALVPADAFFEKGRRFGRRDGQPFWLGGLWERWLGADGSEFDSCCLLTTAANALVAPVHPRMPVVIADHQAEAWLLAQDGPALRALQPLLAPWDPAAWQLIPAAGAHASRQLSLL
jgi:putative SOS response-associated peptidase YedK